MSILEAIFLGLLQGATEFLPISSSGHLVIIPSILNLTPPDLVFVGIVHAGTLLAVLAYFWRDLWDIAVGMLDGLRQRQPMATTNARLGWYILVGTIPAAAAGLLFTDFFESVFGSPQITAFFLMVTGVLLIIGERLLSGDKTAETMTWLDAIIIGLFQMLALLPGVSRSGSTIVGGLVRGLDRSEAARYSFLLGVPAIAGAGLLALVDVLTAEAAFSPAVYLAGFVSAALFGYLCIYFLMAWVRRHSYYPFAIYCLLLGGFYLLATRL